MMRKIFLTFFAFVTLFFIVSPSKALACDITFSPVPSAVGDTATVSVTNWIATGPHVTKVLMNGSVTDAGIFTVARLTDSYSFGQAFNVQGLWGLVIYDLSGNVECQTLKTIRGVPPMGTGAGIPKPSSWLPFLRLGFGPNPSQGINFIIKNFVPFVVSMLVFLIITLSLVFLIIGGIQWTVGGGNKESLAKARNTVTYALIGLALGLGSLVILSIIGRFLNFSLTGA